MRLRSILPGAFVALLAVPALAQQLQMGVTGGPMGRPFPPHQSFMGGAFNQSIFHPNKLDRGAFRRHCCNPAFFGDHDLFGRGSRFGRFHRPDGFIGAPFLAYWPPFPLGYSDGFPGYLAQPSSPANSMPYPDVAPPPRAPAPYQPPSVETTAEGITIVRGHGSGLD